jgi:hypothetical protein
MTQRVALTYSRMSKANPTRIEDQQEAQLHMLRSLREQSGQDIPLYAQYADDGISGFNHKRAGWLWLKIDCGLALDEREQRLAKKLGLAYDPENDRKPSKGTDLILFMADRLARDDVDMITTGRRMFGKGMKIWDAARKVEITDQVLTLMAVMARNEGVTMSMRTTDGMAQQCKRGSKLGDLPFGYQHRMRKVIVDGVETLERDPRYVGRPDIDPVTGPLVTESFKRVARGDTLQAVLDWFNAECRRLNVRMIVKGMDRGIVQRTPWSFKSMLKNPYYAGKNVGMRTRNSYVFDEHWVKPDRKEWAICKEDHDVPLIDWPTFEKVQDRLKRQSRVGQNRKEGAVNAMSGLLHCARCGRRLAPHHGKQHNTGYKCPYCHMYGSEGKLRRMLGGVLLTFDLERGVDAVKLESYAAGRAALEQALEQIDDEDKRLTRRRARLRMQQADADGIDADIEEALRMTDQERAALHARRALVENSLSNMVHDVDISEHRAHIATLCAWVNGEQVEASKVRESLTYCCDKITIDREAQTATVLWSPEMSLLMNQRQAILACPIGRRAK